MHPLEPRLKGRGSSVFGGGASRAVSVRRASSVVQRAVEVVSPPLGSGREAHALSLHEPEALRIGEAPDASLRVHDDWATSRRSNGSACRRRDEELPVERGVEVVRDRAPAFQRPEYARPGEPRLGSPSPPLDQGYVGLLNLAMSPPRDTPSRCREPSTPLARASQTSTTCSRPIAGSPACEP